MDKLATRIQIQQILEDLKIMYFNDYRYVLKFSFTFTPDDIFLRLLYRAFNQRKFQFKLLTLSSKCNLKLDLQPILYNIYRKNLDVETHKYKIRRSDFLQAIGDSSKHRLRRFQLWNCHLFLKNGHGYASKHRLLTIQNKDFVHT